MGYSIGIRAKTKTDHKAMLAFMEAHYRPWPEIVEGKRFAYSSAPTDDLSYDHRKLAIGVDYKSGLGGWEREYAYALTRWMAIRVGRRRSAFPQLDPKIPPFAEPVPYMVYDGYDPWPVVVGTASESKKRSSKIWWCCTDKLGMHNGPEAEAEYLNWVIFTSKSFFDLYQEGVKKSGGLPGPESDPHDWQTGIYMNMLKNAEIKAAVDTAVKPLRDELQRLSDAWEAR